MEERPRFSIITPTLNAERYLSDCLASVAKQDVVLEHIVMDGGSADATESLVQAAGARWVLCAGLNQAAAINRGMEVAKGDLVAWLNADDAYPAGALGRVSDVFVERPWADVVMGNCDMIAADGRTLRHLRAGHYDFQRLLRQGNYISQPAVFWRREVIERVGPLDAELEYAMDYDLWLRFWLLRVEWLDQTLAQFRWHSRSKSSQGQSLAWRENLRVMRRYGGGWTRELRWAFARARLSLLKDRGVARLGALLRQESP